MLKSRKEDHTHMTHTEDGSSQECVEFVVCLFFLGGGVGGEGVGGGVVAAAAAAAAVVVVVGLEFVGGGGGGGIDDYKMSRKDTPEAMNCNASQSSHTPG